MTKIYYRPIDKFLVIMNSRELWCYIIDENVMFYRGHSRRYNDRHSLTIPNYFKELYVQS